LSPRLCWLVAFGIGKRYKGAGCLGFCSPDPLGGLGSMLQASAVAPTIVSEQKLPTSSAAVELGQPWVVSARRWAGGEDTLPSR